MYVPCYEEPFYLRAKAVRLGQQRLPASELEVLETIRQQFGVAAFCFDFKPEREKVRVDLMLDLISDGMKVGYTNQKLLDLFRNFLEQNPDRFLLKATTSIVIHFESFERVATEEMLHLFKTHELNAIYSQFSGIANIHEGPRSFSIFYKTEDQRSTGNDNGMNLAVESHFYERFKKYDPFDYCRRDTIQFHFDSIENVNANYGGDWMNYYH